MNIWRYALQNLASEFSTEMKECEWTVPDIITWIHGQFTNLIGLSFQSSMSEADLRALEKERHYMLVNPTWNPAY